MTNATEIRRLTLVVAAALLLASVPAAAEWESVDSIRDTAARFAAEALGADGRDLRAEAGELDTRLRMTRCDTPLEGFLPNGTGNGSRLIVGVRCAGSKPWKLFVPVRVARYGEVLVVNRSLPRGHLLGAEDVSTERRDLSGQTQTFVGSFDELPGRRLRRPVLAGTALTHNLVDAERLIRRGQKVMLVVDDHGVEIRMAGKALSDGSLDQRIRVENASSRRIIEGIVRSSEIVEVRLN